MTLLSRLCEHFVAPAEAADSERAGDMSPTTRTPPGVAVLCAAPDAPSLGPALGLALAREQRAPCVAVCVWTGEPVMRPPWLAPARPAARRLAANLAARGHEARAAGRLAIVDLPAGHEDAAAGAARAAAAAGSAPTVLALGGPRVGTFDAILEAQDLVVVATRTGTDPALPRLAVAGLAPHAVAACACEVPSGPGARALAAAGVTLLPSARRALAAPVEALP